MSKHGYLNFRLSTEDHARLQAVAHAKGYSLSEIARKCLRVGLRFADDFEPKPTDHAIVARRPEQLPAA